MACWSTCWRTLSHVPWSAVISDVWWSSHVRSVSALTSTFIPIHSASSPFITPRGSCPCVVSLKLKSRHPPSLLWQRWLHPCYLRDKYFQTWFLELYVLDLHVKGYIDPVVQLLEWSTFALLCPFVLCVQGDLVGGHSQKIKGMQLIRLLVWVICYNDLRLNFEG